MKKYIQMIFTAALLCTFTGCSGQTDNEPAPAASETPAAEAVETASAEPVSTAEAGQNPVMNVIGSYAADRANMLVEADGDDGARFTVSWADSAFETNEWTMSGKFDEKDMSAAYDNCVRKKLVFNEKGELTSDETLYENGTGKVVFDYEAGTLTWTDDQDHAADGMVFGFVPVSASEEGGQFLGSWVCGRALIEITEADGDMPFNVMITWANSAADHAEWVYDCYYDGEALVSNETGTKTTVVFNEKGQVVSSEEAFNDGAVRLSINDRGMLVWEDFKEDAGKDMEFEKIG